MKLLRRIAVLLLAAMCALTSAAYASPVPQDVIGTRYETAASLLCKLEIMVGDGTNFNPDDNITRAEFAQILMKTLNMGEAMASYTPVGMFDDVPAANIFAPAIELGAGLGAIQGVGDNRFDPDNNVTGNEAIKLMVYAAGYQALAENSGGYPSGYIYAAQDVGLLKQLTGLDYAAPMTRGQAAQLCVNTLKADMAQPASFGENIWYEVIAGESLLTERHNVYTVSGVVCANDVTSMWGGGNVREGDVQILASNGLMTLEAADTGAETMIGQYVNVYYRYDSETESGTALYVEIPDSRNTIVEVDLEDIEYTRLSPSSVYYWKDKENDSRATQLMISSVPSILYNGATVAGGTNAQTLFERVEGKYGTALFVDSNNDGNIDMISVKAYDTYIVDRRNTVEYRILDKLGTYTYDAQTDTSTRVNRYVTIDEESANVSVTYADTAGNALSFADLEQNDVLSVAMSDESTGNHVSVEVLVSRSQMSGTVTALQVESASDLRIYIDGTPYKVTDSYLNYLSQGRPLAEAAGNMGVRPGMTGTFWLDSFGRIAWSELAGSATSDMEFGIITAYALERMGGVAVKLFNGVSLDTYALASSVKIDGIVCKGEAQAMAALDAVAGELTGVYYEDGTVIIPVLFRFSDGYIRELDTCVYNADTESEYSLHSVNTNGRPETLTYMGTAQSFNYKYPVGSAIVMTVPSATDASDLSDEENFGVLRASNLTSGRAYTAQIFNTDPNSIEASYILIQTEASRITSLGDTPSAIHDRQMLIISNIVETIGVDGDATIRIEGYEEGTYKELTVDADYYQGTMFENIWDNTWFSNAEAKALIDAGPSAERRNRKLLVGDIIRYRTNSDGEIAFLRPTFLSDIRVFRADDQGSLSSDNRYRAFDIAAVSRLDGTSMSLRYLIDKSTGNATASMAVKVDANGYVLQDSTGTMLYNGTDYCEAGVAGAAWRTDAVFDADAFRGITIYDETKPLNQRVYVGSPMDLYDTNELGNPASLVIMQFRSSTPRGMIILKLRD